MKTKFGPNIGSRPKYLNVACGAHYLVNDNWLNVDFQSRGKSVVSMNLLKHLPIESGTIEFVYCSHFIEHLYPEDARIFLSEVYRILKSGGSIRIVTPDLEEMVLAYLNQIRQGNVLFASFVRSEIFDQIVRRTPSGDFPNWYMLASKDSNLRDFIKDRIGYSPRLKHLPKEGESFFHKILGFSRQITFRKIYFFLSKKYCLLLTNFFPRWFRDYHVSLATPGERHLCIYDWYSISDLLTSVGFSNVTRVTHDNSKFGPGEAVSLDILNDGSPRGGRESMFVEAVKP